MSPYRPDGPCVVFFSGGRTSGYMLYRFLEENGELPDDLKVIFANTGKEMPETLDFVNECSVRWGVPVVWLERRVRRGGEGENKYVYTTEVVDYETASRNGEPFASLIEARQYLPNPVARFCTAELKVRAIQDYMRDRFDSWEEAVGIRYDEPRRAAKMKRESRVFLPLFQEGATVRDVAEFWERSPFDLRLPNENGVTSWGNCDLCFLKGAGKKLSVIESRPDLSEWWADQEAMVGGRFRNDQPSYREMQVIASSQGGFDFEGEDNVSCFCGD